MNFALVGGAGFVGHHLALALRKRSHRVVCIDALAVNNRLSLWESERSEPRVAAHLRMIDERLALLSEAGAEIYTADARDYHYLSRLLRMVEAEVVVHLAAIAHIDRADKDPLSTFDHSLRTLENALDASKALKMERFVYFSSSTVYGNFPKPVLTEEDECRPFGIYGSLKLAGELIVKAYHQTFQLPYTIIRPMALYGPRCVSGRVTQKFIEAAILGESITIQGDPTSKHDFTYIDDLVDGFELAMASEAGRNQTFNITAGDARSIGEVAGIVAKCFPNLLVVAGPADVSKPSRGTLSTRKARDLLGYKPKFNLVDGMAAYVDWYRQFWPREKEDAVSWKSPQGTCGRLGRS